MITNTTNIADCIFYKPSIFSDKRGFFSEIYKQSLMPGINSVQTNFSKSKAGVLRGVHRTPYSKFVTCVSGKIYDVCVDLRKDSPTYTQHFGLELNDTDLVSLYIPSYCGHAFLALEDSIVIYHQTGEYDKSVDETYCYKNFDIAWPIQPTIISDKDLFFCDGSPF